MVASTEKYSASGGTSVVHRLGSVAPCPPSVYGRCLNFQQKKIESPLTVCLETKPCAEATSALMTALVPLGVSSFRDGL